MKRSATRLQPKLLLGLVILAIVLAASLTPTIARLYRRSMEEQYSKVAFDQASIAAGLIDGDKIREYYETMEKDEYYDQVSRELLLMKKTVGLKYFYVVVPEEKQMVYIWDVGEPGEEGVCELGDADDYYGGGDELMHAAFAVDAPQTILITNNETYGYLASAYVAILDSAGVPVALASVDVSMDAINREIRQFVLLSLLITCCVLAVSVITYYFYIRKILIRPLASLHDAAQGLVKDNMEKLDEFSNTVHTGDELEELGEAFAFMTRELSEYIKNFALATAEKERIGAELNVATQIQADMLPRIFPAFPGRKEFDIYATMTPAKEVGGDFYDFFMVDDRHLAIVMADVSGKGVPAALFMVIGKTLIKDHTQPGRDLGETFTRVNDLLCESNNEGLFITAFEGVLDLVTGEFQYVNAGHEPPFLCKKGGSFQAQKITPGFVLAGMEGMAYRYGSVKLEPGDKLFQYTDGVTEATDSHDQLYGMERLAAVLEKNSGATPAQLLPRVKEDIDAFVGDAPQFDDITMLCLEYKQFMEEDDK